MRSYRYSWLSRLGALVRAAFRRSTDADVDVELRAYVDERVSRLELTGLSGVDARRAALAEIGSLESVKEETRRVHPWHEVRTSWRDAGQGARALRRSKGFAIVVIATLALGVGASVTMFSVMHAVMWRPLPYPDSGRLVVIDSSLGPVQVDGIAPGAVRNLRDWSRTLSSFAFGNGAEAFITVGDGMERVSSASVSDDMLPLLGGLPMALGRTNRSEIDIDPKVDTVTGVVISHRLWQRVFQGDPNVIGRPVEINNRDRTIIGVLRPDLRVWLPAAAGMDEAVDVWFPNPIENEGGATGRPVLAKLGSGLTLAQAQSELDLLAPRLMAEHPDWYSGGLGDSKLRLRARPLSTVVAAPATRGLTALGAAVAFVLLIACVNAANLMLARGSARRREIAIRTALGASRARVIRQLLTEDLVLAGGSAALGLVIARGGIGLVDWLRPLYLPRQSEIAIDGTVALVAVLLSVTVTLLAGLVPALQLSGRPLLSLRSSVAESGGRRLRRVLVITEVALSIVPLVAAGLMLRTFVNLSNTPLGFNPSGVLTAHIGYSYQRFPNVASITALYRNAIRAVAALPNVDAVTATGPLPLAPVQAVRRFRRGDDPEGQGLGASQQTVLPGALDILQIPLVAGRDISDDDITAGRDVAIVDQRFADAMWRGNALGQRIVVGSGKGLRVLDVIGVTRPLKARRLRDDPLPHVFVPYHVWPREMVLVIRTNSDMVAVGTSVKHAVEALGTERAMWGIRPMNGYLADAMDETRFTMLLLACFAALSLLLSAVGLYGTLAYLISQRKQEFGVRLALGASAARIVGLVATEGALLTGTGAAIGIVASLAVARLLRGLLYGVEPVDAVTLAGVAILAVLVGLAAVSQPAWRASRVDPNTVLRSE